MRVLITGAGGRIGRALIDALPAAGFALRLVDVQPPPDASRLQDWRQADVTVAEAIVPHLAGIDAVIHLAGHPNSRDWATVERVNMAASRTVFEAAGGAGVRRILFASSIHVWGWHPSDVAFTDDLPERPDGPYGVSKVAGEAMLSYACDRWAMQGYALRICSFKPAPTQARDLRTWLSPADMAALATACLRAEVGGTTRIWGLSANTRSGLDSAVWRRIGYNPRDDAERHVASLEANGVDLSVVSEWPRLGGGFAEWDDAGPAAQRQSQV